MAASPGFGQDGPYEGRAGVDQIAQGMGGLMSITGLPGQGPVRVGIPIDDLPRPGSCSPTASPWQLLDGHPVSALGRLDAGLSCQATRIFTRSGFRRLRWLIAASADQATTIQRYPDGGFPTSDGHINIAASSTSQWDPAVRRSIERIGRRTA